MTNRRPPSLANIVKTEMLALIGALAPPIGVGIAVAGWAGVLPDRGKSLVEGRLVSIPSQGIGASILLGAGFVVVGAVLLAWRAARIRAAFGSGHRVPGTITRLQPFKDRAYIHYAYVIHGTRHETRHFVHQTAAVRRLGEGQAVTVAVDPRQPRVAFVDELFDG